MHSLRTRIAPTPSGYLHLGNIANFLLVEKLVKQAGGELLLRIDDCDGTRARKEFVEHIFETLRWLGIEWQGGPRDSADFYQHFSQVARKETYFERLRAFSGHTYACSCSRKTVDGIYRGSCRERRLDFAPGKTALRLRIDDPAVFARFGDPVLWRKDGGPAYHWVSVVDDLEARVTLIVRGEDLKDSSELQKHIALLLAPGGFRQVRFVHHPLLVGQDGKKLSKSQLAESVQELRGAGMEPAELRERLAPVIAGWA